MGPVRHGHMREQRPTHAQPSTREIAPRSHTRLHLTPVSVIACHLMAAWSRAHVALTIWPHRCRLASAVRFTSGFFTVPPLVGNPLVFHTPWLYAASVFCFEKSNHRVLHVHVMAIAIISTILKTAHMDQMNAD